MIKKIEISIWWNCEVRSLFLRSLSKHCSFDSCGDIINPKLDPNGPKLVFHVPMVIEKVFEVKHSFFRNHCLKIVKFWLPVVTSSTQRWVKKGSRLVFHMPMLIDWWKSRVKGTVRLWEELSFTNTFSQNFGSFVST